MQLRPLCHCQGRSNIPNLHFMRPVSLPHTHGSYDTTPESCVHKICHSNNNHGSGADFVRVSHAAVSPKAKHPKAADPKTKRDRRPYILQDTHAMTVLLLHIRQHDLHLARNSLTHPDFKLHQRQKQQLSLNKLHYMQLRCLPHYHEQKFRALDTTCITGDYAM